MNKATPCIHSGSINDNLVCFSSDIEGTNDLIHTLDQVLGPR